ncbi:MAG TPA: hypothetical protein PLK94_09735 [Alphaproteobacteria bacterium]|nr:hypothetical protein [Alphaproteobacteria bacterium]
MKDKKNIERLLKVDEVAERLAVNERTVYKFRYPRFYDIPFSVLEQLGDKAITVVAGYPKSVDELKAKGLKHFIHVKSNLIETLEGFQNELGV